MQATKRSNTEQNAIPATLTPAPNGAQLPLEPTHPQLRQKLLVQRRRWGDLGKAGKHQPTHHLERSDGRELNRAGPRTPRRPALTLRPRSGRVGKLLGIEANNGSTQLLKLGSNFQIRQRSMQPVDDWPWSVGQCEKGVSQVNTGAGQPLDNGS